MAMLLTSRQAAEKLGMTPKGISQLVKRGELTNHNPKAGNGHRTALLLSPGEVRELAKTRRPVSRRQPRAAELVSPGAGLLSRLDRMEDKLDELLALWR